VTLGAYAHQNAPYEQVVRELRPERSLSRTPLVQALFVMQNAPMPPAELPGLSLRQLPLYTDTAEFELIVSVEEAEGKLAGTFAYSVELFDRATVVRMQRHFTTLLENILRDPDQRLSSLPVLSREEVGGVSPADFPDAELSRKDFESLFSGLSGGRT
jgi:non-ribosomal peptide synthetase component F